MYDRLDEVRADIATRLEAAARDRNAPMHTPVIATADADARIMVLRGFDAEGWVLRFHTDARSPKVAVIEADPRIAVLAYDKPAKIQLRLRGRARIERVGAAVDAAWADSPNFARRCYLGEGPGTDSTTPTSGLPREFEGVEPDDDQVVPARANFALLLIEVDVADWFSLAHTGHRRALLTRDEGQWITP
ncbi:pyridoxamine 5'-phosphate oxidase family protein [Qipengyuania qiaonensis]|uniref:Pyridoxamine 5'-phosphate oxidase family protein n=1 Tax=Qipengyuania qiaonensis TaxID=2867240 RepID=A0ABS7J6U1_9SPHN|nr:pyridoxamine 5'-phosphate oxidase family protein [Qipengyuania qiaonensis]MBX7483024.1 pyridoxamine 5'-phosphate oxidase family protein [Qipengyuania qiaonensis]